LAIRSKVKFSGQRRETDLAIRENKFPLIGDISLKLEKRDDRTACVVSLDMGTGEVPVNSGTFEVSFTRAFLKVVCNGYEIIKSSRYGIPRKAQISKTKRTTEVDTHLDLSTETEVSLEGSVSATEPPTASAIASTKAAAGVQKSHSTTDETETEILFHLVKARGGDTWEIGDKTKGDSLDGNYLDDDVLFEFSPLKETQGNMRSIEIYLIVQQSDMDLNHSLTSGWNVGQNSFFSVNRKKLSKIFSGKCLAKVYSLEEPYNGKFAISYIEEDVPDEYFPE
jgi:hypothetical protein